MVAGADKSYSFRSKSRWRRSVWKYVSKCLKQTGRLPRSSRGLVLLGKRGFDLWHARYLGFSWDNIVAVEHDEDAARETRRIAPCMVVRAELSEYLAYAEYPKPVDFIVADLCTNYSTVASQFTSRLLRSPLLHPLGTVVIVNFMRGRESKSVFWNEKHRGKRFFWSIFHSSGRDPGRMRFVKLHSYKNDNGIVMDSCFCVLYPQTKPKIQPDPESDWLLDLLVVMPHGKPREMTEGEQAENIRKLERLAEEAEKKERAAKERVPNLLGSDKYKKHRLSIEKKQRQVRLAIAAGKASYSRKHA